MTPKDEIHWPTTAAAPPECARLEGKQTVDVLIIGGGLTGTRTALALADAGVNVAIADSKEIGYGASGRSGGQCNPIWRKTPAQLAQSMGERYAANLVETTLRAADDLFSDIRKYDVDCDPVQNGWVQAAHTRKASKAMRALGEAWSAAGAEIQVLEGDSVREASGSPAYSFGLFHPKGGNVHPLSLTRGYAKAAAERGAALFEKTLLTSLERVDGKWHAKSTDGEIVAENVVLATNGYTDALWPGLRQSFQPLVSIIMATQPLTHDQQQEVLPNKVTIADTRLAINYSRYDRDGRLIFGCIGSSENVNFLGGFGRLKRGLAIVFPQIADIGIERRWGGRIAVTPDMMPRLHEPAPGILAGLGYSGRGIAMTSVMGRALAAKVLGADPNDLPFPIAPIKPLSFYGVTSRCVPLFAPAMELKDKFDVMTNGA